MIVVDTDVLVALVNRADPGHPACVEALRALREPLATVWPALAPALTRTSGFPAAQRAILEMVDRGALTLLDLGNDDASALRALLGRRRAQPLSVAHAALIRVAQRDGLEAVFTLTPAPLARQNLGGGRRLRTIPAGSRSTRTARRGQP